MKLDIIIFIVIVVIVCLGAIWAWCDDISCKVWAEQWDDLDKKLKYSKLGLIYPPNNDAVIVKADRILQEDVIKFIKDENLKQLNEEKARVLDNMMCSSKQFEVALEQMRDCTAKPTIKEVVGTMSDKQKEVMDYLVNPPISDEILTFGVIVASNEMRKMFGLDELEEYEATIKDFTVKRVSPYDDHATTMDEEEEPKSKKLEPLICKMCGGTVAKKGDIYECEYCGLHYELR